MGFWHTGYMEFHEEVGWDFQFKPIPVYYRCQQCPAVFDNPDALWRHRFEEHPSSRPSLFFCGKQLGTTSYRISQNPTPADFVVDRALSASLNGQAIALGDLGKRLATIDNDRVTVELTNDGASAKFEIEFSIASERDLRGVDSCFETLSNARHLDIRAIDEFINSAKPFSSARYYYDGICQYLYGVLAKERALDSSLSYSDYRDKFSQAAESLGMFDRGLARIIRGIVAFHFNHFEDVVQIMGHGRLAHASSRFIALLGGKGKTDAQENSSVIGKSPEDVLIDNETNQIVIWSRGVDNLSKNEIRDISGLLTKNISEFDKVKLNILLAEWLFDKREFTKARRVARNLINTTLTAAWAQKMLDRFPIEGRQ